MVRILRIGPVSIGLSLSADGARYIELDRKGQQISRIGYLPFDKTFISEGRIIDSAGLQQALRPWIKDEGLTKRTVHTCIPTNQAFVRKVRIVKASRSKVRKMIELEVNDVMQLPFEDPVWDYALLQPSEQTDDAPQPQQNKNTQLDALVVAAPRSLIDGYVSVLHDAGLKVRSVDLTGLALYRTFATYYAKPLPDDFLIISLSEESAEMYLFIGGVPDLNRVIALQNLFIDMSDEGTNQWKWREIESETVRMLDFYEYNIQEGRAAIRDVVVMGSMVRKASFIEYLRSNLTRVQIHALDFRQMIPNDQQFQLDGYGVPIGLALKEISLK